MRVPRLGIVDGRPVLYFAAHFINICIVFSYADMHDALCSSVGVFRDYVNVKCIVPSGQHNDNPHKILRFFHIFFVIPQ